MDSAYFSLISIVICTWIITNKFSQTPWKSRPRFKVAVYVAITAVAVLAVNNFIDLTEKYSLMTAFFIIVPAFAIWLFYFLYKINKPLAGHAGCNDENK